MTKFTFWIRSHPWFSAVFTLVALGWATHEFLNWRAERRWQNYCAEARSRGVKLTLLEFAPPEIPDAENFAALPMFRAAFANGSSPAFELPKYPGTLTGPGFGNPVKGELIDWKQWQDFFKTAGFIAETTDEPARDVLRALDHYAPEIAEWSEWRTRPRSCFPLNLKAGATMALLHLNIVTHAAKLFALRLRAHLSVGDSAAAIEDFRDNLQAYRALADEPTLISGLVRISAVSQVSNGVGCGLRESRWSEPQLRAIETASAKVSLWRDYRSALESERGFCNGETDSLVASSPAQRGPTLAAHFSAVSAGLGVSPIPTPPPLAATLFALVPDRILRGEQLRTNRLFDATLARIAADDERIDTRMAMPLAPASASNPFEDYYFFLTRITSPAFAVLEEYYFRIHTQLDQTLLACALERYHLTRGEYPPALAELVPEFVEKLPLDVYADAPLKYRRTESGSFVLYSVGENRVDDGGAIDPKLSEKKQRDAVWLYAPAVER